MDKKQASKLYRAVFVDGNLKERSEFLKTIKNNHGKMGEIAWRLHCEMNEEFILGTQIGMMIVLKKEFSNHD